MPANIPTLYSVPYDGKLNIDEFSEGIEKAMPSGYRISRDSEKHSMKVHAGLFLYADVTIRHDEDEGKYVVQSAVPVNSMKDILRDWRTMLMIFLTGYIFAVYFHFFVRPKVKDLDEHVGSYVRTRLREMGYLSW